MSENLERVVLTRTLASRRSFRIAGDEPSQHVRMLLACQKAFVCPEQPLICHLQIVYNVVISLARLQKTCVPTKQYSHGTMYREIAGNA